MSGKQCPVSGCTRRKQASYVMCGRHWYMVPKAMRDEVWKTYRANPGSNSHRKAVFAALLHVAKLERSNA